MTVKSYRDLLVWQKAMDLVEVIYRVTADFPKDEIYGLTAQLRRAAVSIPSNIAEGRSRQSTPDLLRFLSIAYGSLSELETQVLIAERLHYLNSESRESPFTQSAELGRMLNGLSTSLRHPPEP